MARLTINTIEIDKTYELNGYLSGMDGYAEQIDNSTIRIVIDNRRTIYSTESGFSDFFIDSVNPTDAQDAVIKINYVINFN